MLSTRLVPCNGADYLDRAALLDLELDPATVAALLRASPHTGHSGPVVDAEFLPDLLALLRREGRQP